MSAGEGVVPDRAAENGAKPASIRRGLARQRTLGRAGTLLWLILGVQLVGLAQEESSEPGAVSGVVVDSATGRPLADASVCLCRDGFTVDQVWTDSLGRFVFPAVRPGEYRLLTSRLGYFPTPPWDSAAVRVSASQWRDGVRIGIMPLAALSGTVRDDRDRPLPGVPVRALRRVPLAGRLHYVAGPVAMTDDRGAYSITAVPEGTYVVVALPTRPSTGAIQAPASVSFHPSTGSISSASQVVLRAGTEASGIDVTVPIVSTGWISGRLQTAQPEPGHDVHLLAAGCEGIAFICEVDVVRTDSAGRFNIRAVPEGDYSLHVGHLAGPIFIAPEETIPRSSRETTIFSAVRSSPRGGSLVFLPDTNITILSRGQVNGPFGRAMVRVDSEKETESVIHAESSARLAGRLRWDNGDPPRGLGRRLFLEAADGSGVPIRATVDQDTGAFDFSSVPPGDYVIGFSGEFVSSVGLDGLDFLDRPISLLGGAEINGVEIRLAGNRTGVGGLVTGRQERIVVRVLAFPTERRRWAGLGLRAQGIRSVVPDTDGNYELDLPPGDYFVLAVPAPVAEACLYAACLERLSAHSAVINVRPGGRQRRSLAVIEGAAQALR